MAFDSASNTISIDKDSDFNIDSGVFFVTTLRTLSQDENAPSGLVDDWKTIEQWLGCTGRNLSKIEEDKISKAWKAYFAIGMAPSLGLNEAFDYFSNKYSEESYSPKEDKPPKQIIEVFDRFLATDEEITIKRNYDLNSTKKTVETALKNNKNKLTLKQRIIPKTMFARIFTVFSVSWIFWVILRTAKRFELFGFDFYYWDEDMFIFNLSIPILFVWLGLKIYKWISTGSK